MPHLTKENEKNVLPLMYAMNVMTKEDFEKAFEKVVEFVLGLKKQQEQVLTKMEETFGLLLQRNKKDYDSNFQRLETQFEKEQKMMSQTHEKMYAEHEKMISKIDYRLGELKDGKDADEKQIIKSVLSQIDFSKQIEPVKTKLESLTIDSIGGLQKVLDKFTQELKNTRPTIMGRAFGMRKVPIIKRYRLTDQVDGSTKTFTLPKDTVDVLGLWGTQFPITFDSNDWTFSGNTLTLADGISAPQSGQTLMAIIETLFYG